MYSNRYYKRPNKLLKTIILEYYQDKYLKNLLYYENVKKMEHHYYQNYYLIHLVDMDIVQI